MQEYKNYVDWLEDMLIIVTSNQAISSNLKLDNVDRETFGAKLNLIGKKATKHTKTSYSIDNMKKFVDILLDKYENVENK